MAHGSWLAGGPARALGGNRILRGTIMLQDLKALKKWIVRKKPDSTIQHQLFKKYRGLLKIVFDLLGFTYVLTIWGFQRFINIPPSCFSVFTQNGRD